MLPGKENFGASLRGDSTIMAVELPDASQALRKVNAPLPVSEQ